MKWFLTALMAYTSIVSCSQRIITLHNQDPQQRIVTLHLSRIQQPLPKQKHHHKAYKRAFLRHSPKQVENLSKNKCSTAIPEKQKKAILAIIARTHNKKTQQDLFKAGLAAGLYTKEMALKSAHAMRKHARKLKRLAQK